MTMTQPARASRAGSTCTLCVPRGVQDRRELVLLGYL